MNKQVKETKDLVTEIVCIIDKSGSMHSIKNDAIGGFNTFIEEQKKLEGKANVSLVLFNTEYSPVYYNKPLNEVESLNEKTFQPVGGTALLDAIGRTLNELMTKEGSEIAPDKYLVVILTDGEENSSREYTNEAIKKIIEDLRAKGNWEFAYLGANQDAFSVAGGMGISVSNSMNFTADSKDTQILYRKMSKMSASYRSSAMYSDTSNIMAQASLEVDKEIEEENSGSKK